MALTAVLYSMTDPNNKLTKTLTPGTSITNILLKEDTSIMEPVLYVSTSASVFNYNYMYINDLARYYFITDIKSVANNRWEITGHIDVLQTYNSEIKKMQGVIAKSETAYNSYLKDNLPQKNRPLITTKEFPTAFDYNNTSIILTVAGSHV